MDTLYFLHLQIFAVQTTELDDTGNDLSPEMKTFYEKVLLKNLKPNLVHAQFGQKKNIPKNGGKTIEFRRFSKACQGYYGIDRRYHSCREQLGCTDDHGDDQSVW